MRCVASAADDAGVLGAAAVDERGLDDALGVEAGEVEERAVDAIHRAAFADDLRVPVATRTVEVPEGRVVGGDQDGGARLGDAVAQPGSRSARFALERSVLLDLRLLALLEDHHAQAKRHECDRSDQQQQLE